jgi:hypothetical protein
MNEKISWCKKQKKGIELVEPNENLCEAYFEESMNTLRLIKGEKNKWELIMAYYSCYNALYSILMKLGIKCEIHDCTINLMKIIDGFNVQDIEFISDLKIRRIRAQYYLKNEILGDLLPIKKFVQKCSLIRKNLNIKRIRDILNEKK